MTDLELFWSWFATRVLRRRVVSVFFHSLELRTDVFPAGRPEPFLLCMVFSLWPWRRSARASWWPSQHHSVFKITYRYDVTIWNTHGRVMLDGQLLGAQSLFGDSTTIELPPVHLRPDHSLTVEIAR